MHILSFFNCCTFFFISIKQFIKNFIRHMFVFSFSCRIYQPSNSQSLSSFAFNLNRNLIGSTTNSSRSYFNGWFNIINSFIKNIYRFIFRFSFYFFNCIVNNFSSNTSFAIVHYIVNQFWNNSRIKFWIWNYVFFWLSFFSRHYLPFLVPYKDLLFFLLATPWVSRLPLKI